MLAQERKKKIVDLVNKNSFVKLSDLSRELNITDATIRRDLTELDEMHLIKRVHGGAESLKEQLSNDFKQENFDICKSERMLIAKAAYKYIDSYDSILLDGSTTVFELAKLLAKGEKVGLSILTNAFDIAAILGMRNDFTVIHTGGRVSSPVGHCYGIIAEKIMRETRVDKGFFGTFGVDPTYGYSVDNFEIAATKTCMLRSCKQTFVLADHTKLGITYMAKFANFTGDIENLITDSLPAGLSADQFSPSVNLIIVQEKSVTKKQV